MHDAVFRQAEKDWYSFVEKLTEKLIEVDDTVPELPVKDVVRDRHIPLHHTAKMNDERHGLRNQPAPDLPHLSRHPLLPRSYSIQSELEVRCHASADSFCGPARRPAL